MADVIGFPHGRDRPGDVYDPLPSECNPNTVDPPINPIACAALENAYRLIEGDRHIQHGKAEKNHDAISGLWTWWDGFTQDRHDAAIKMALVKLARIKTGSYNADDYDDLIGYIALAKQFRHTEASPR